MTAYTDIKKIPLFAYDFIMADPPWLFKNYSAEGEGKNATAKYGCMSLDDIKAMPVSDIARRDCILWLWATNPMLPQAIEIMGAWGFTFKTAGTWAKMTSKGNQHFGTGYILRSACEPFLIGTMGEPKTSRSVRSCIMAEVREHSRKPELAYSEAEKMYPQAVRRMDFFSRQKRDGWDSFGNEVSKFQDA